MSRQQFGDPIVYRAAGVDVPHHARDHGPVAQYVEAARRQLHHRAGQGVVQPPRLAVQVPLHVTRPPLVRHAPLPLPLASRLPVIGTLFAPWVTLYAPPGESGSANIRTAREGDVATAVWTENGLLYAVTAKIGGVRLLTVARLVDEQIRKTSYP